MNIVSRLFAKNEPDDGLEHISSKREVVETAFQLYAYFALKFLGSLFGLTSPNEALQQTNAFFSEARFDGGRALLEHLLQLCLLDHLEGEELHFRMHEHFVRLDVSDQKGKPCSFKDPDVQATCGTLYLNGDRLKRNAERAIGWLEKSAKQDNIYALYTLARLHLNGDGTIVNPARAVMLLERAATLGDADSAALVAGLFDNSGIVPTDYARAAKWARVAASLGSAHAQGHLGLLYASGHGLPQDIIEAYAWTFVSAEAGNETSRANLQSLTESMSTLQRESGLMRARQLKPGSSLRRL